MKANIKIKLGGKEILDLDNVKLIKGELLVDKLISEEQWKEAKEDNGARLTVIVD